MILCRECGGDVILSEASGIELSFSMAGWYADTMAEVFIRCYS